MLPDGDSHAPRRRILAGLGAAVTTGLAGCSGRLPGAKPVQLDTDTIVEHDPDPRLLWRYPPREDDQNGIGYAAVEIDRIIQRDNRHSTMHLTFNSTR